MLMPSSWLKHGVGSVSQMSSAEKGKQLQDVDVSTTTEAARFLCQQWEGWKGSSQGLGEGGQREGLSAPARSRRRH